MYENFYNVYDGIIIVKRFYPPQNAHGHNQSQWYNITIRQWRKLHLPNDICREFPPTAVPGPGPSPEALH